MRKPMMILVALGLLVVLAGALVVSAGGSRTVYTRGDETVQPNAIIKATLRFSPGPITVNSGDTVSWVHDDKTEAPHTVTVVSQADLPSTFEEIFACTEPGEACGDALFQHFVGGSPVLDGGVPVDPTLPIVLDGEADSVLFFHGQSFDATIDAPPGSTLYYLCAIHPWMQGTITVKP